MKKLISAALAAALAVGAVMPISAAQGGGLRGDVNLDGRVTINDATDIQKYCASIIELSPEQLEAADLNGNGDVTVGDATVVQKIVAGMDENGGKNPDEEQLTPEQIRSDGQAAEREFAAKLLKASVSEGKSTLISPMSVMSALGMVMNGANGKTLSQMESTLGLSRNVMNGYFKTYSMGECAKTANSVWLNKDLYSADFSRDFNSAVAENYNAAAYPESFNDETLKKINSWVKDNTDGMIDGVLDKINPEALMYLINAVSFESDWESKYLPHHVYDNYFNNSDGSKSEVKMMYSTEERYISGEGYQGFAKEYNDNYSFVAVLPDKGTKLSDFVNSLDGEKINKFFDYSYDYDVTAALPKFEFEYSDILNNELSALGMGIAFNSAEADFTKLVNENSMLRPFISSVIHKTYISVAEEGTRAGAVTAIEMEAGSAYDPDERERKTVYLDRPFLYMIVNNATNTPLFIGTVESL